MKNRMLILLCLIAFPAFLIAQNEAREVSFQQEEKVSGPVMTFETTTIDYGKVEYNSEPLRVFKFTNTGTEPLIIMHAQGSCGCTVPSFPREPVLPGESGEIEVRYDTKRPGRFAKTIRLTTNELQPTRVLTVRGEVERNTPQESAPVRRNVLSPGSNQ